jgi:hypothetical protein
MRGQSNWIRACEHWVLRLASLVFSLVSAHAILWFFSALDWVDWLQPDVKIGIAAAFGVLGYFVSRGLAHRLLNRESITAYIFICAVFELVEVVCNYSMAAASVDRIAWLFLVHGELHQVLVVLAYIVLSIIPLVTILLAWVDMDLERAKVGYTVRGFGMASASVPTPVMPPARPAPLVPGQKPAVPYYTPPAVSQAPAASYRSMPFAPSPATSTSPSMMGLSEPLPPVAAAPQVNGTGFGGFFNGLSKGVAGWFSGQSQRS